MSDFFGGKLKTFKVVIAWPLQKIKEVKVM
jgi:hypothetical protein